MNAVQSTESGDEEYLYCPQCCSELILGAKTKEGKILEPEVGKVVLEPLPEAAEPVVMCRDCQWLQVMKPEEVFVYDGPAVADPYEDR